MKKWGAILMLMMLLALSPLFSDAQCSICTRSAQQLGEKPAKALNNGIIYLAAMPLAIFGFIAYRWWKINKD
jgi:hypothetical protein